MEALIEPISDYERERGKPMPTVNHSSVQGELLFCLKTKYRKQYSIMPEINVTMPERPDAVPDIAIFSKFEIDYLHDIQSMTQMPLTAIEIISPSQSNDDILAKFDRYFAAGVKTCWLVIPSFKAISVYTAPGVYQFFMHNSVLNDPVTAISINVSDVFE